MREIVLDTETTGLDPADGHRVVEIGCVEVLNCIPTGQIFHRYLNPERDMPADALKVHGLSGEFLADKPRFAEIIDEFLDFLGDARLVVHNAEFDLRFLNAELARPQRPPLGMDRVLDTLALARRRHPGQPNSLDALCARYGIDASRRTTHGALLDAEILAEVYAELSGGRQTSLRLGTIAGIAQKVLVHGLRQRPAPLTSRLTQLEAAAHAAFVATFESAPLWNLYLEPAVPA
ncbi:MAG: DNA polymerase III subunit epsilon [Methylobacteriaceae bacterium]|nr:DNA polymerase III subunit epsilon [Methylobacteriaceae bacterium]